MNLETVALSKKENKRAVVLAKVDSGEMTAAQAKEVIGLGIRQIKRLLAKYREEEKLEVSRSSVRRILMKAGIKSPRRRRERMPQQGMMLGRRSAGLAAQPDGSRHAWLEERGTWLSLVGAIDDATGEVPYIPVKHTGA